MKANSKSFKGIEYVVVNELPAEQQSLLDQKNNIERIKILMDGKIVSNCISYQTYSDWFHTTFKQRASVSRIHQEAAGSSKVAFKKA